MKTYYLICKIIAVLPFILLFISMLLLGLFNCEGNEGTGKAHCQYFPDEIGSALIGISRSSMFGFPVVLLFSGLLALFGKLVEKFFIGNSNLDDSNL